jgi:hypothetical protein
MEETISLADRLRIPFAADEIEWRVQSSGKTQRGPWVRVLAYVTNRAIMERLDSAVGIEGWRNEFTHAPSGAVLCGLSLKINGEWITKWDGANETDIEAAKGGISNAMKRAAVQWGIGRYLYNLEEGYASIASDDDRGAEYLKANKDKHGDALRWRPPRLPAWALPGGSGKPDVVSPQQEQKAQRAEATLRAPAQAEKKTDTATTASAKGTLLIPGTKAHFDGYGGKRIGDVPSEALVKIVAVLREKDETRYAVQIDAIDSVLDERTQAAVS